MSVLASLFMAGCSQEEIAPNDDGNGGSNTSYMAVNLVSSDATGSRTLSGYQDGSDVENHVEKVRFYFFNGVGAAIDVKLIDDNYVNYYDWVPNTANADATPDDPDQSQGTIDSDDIESKLKAIIVINTKNGDGIPQRIAAVLNPTGLDDESKSLTELKAIVGDYATGNLTKKGKFVMFNSVGGNGKEFSTTLIKAENLCQKEKDAIANPVTIYVERNVAKVSVALSDAVKDAAGNTGLKLKDKKGNDLTIDGNQVYLKLGGWGLTAETSEGRLIKKVNPKWEGDWWYTTYRSFWAINSMTATNRYHDYTNSINTSIGKDNYLYTNENAQKKDIDAGIVPGAPNKTKVILKGTLCKANGDAFTIVRHLGVHFADNDNLDKLKESILNQLNATGHYYYYAEGSGKKQIGVSDLKIVIATQDHKEESDNNCYVYAQLTADAEKKTWYNSMDAGAIAITDGYKEINGILSGKDSETGKYYIDRALVWNSGMTYYYYPIKHLAESNQDGVVRNHIYKTTVTKIAGLGTPVYDPSQTIYPEKPDENDHYIAAQIYILSWRIVSNNYELNW